MNKAVTLTLLAVMAPAQADAPMAYLRTFGPAADPVTRLNHGLIVISLLVVAIIAALVLYACLRRRPPLPLDAAGTAPGQIPVETDKGGMPWIYVGVGISSILLLGSTVWTLLILSAVAAPAKRSAPFSVEVTAHQFWWEVRYLGAEPSQAFTTANEIHIPVGLPVQFKLMSDDVIHSFWVPKLGGKTDMIPGRANRTWLQADAAGEYRGQCGEFCGPQHAHMALYVVADTPAQFDAWWRAQMAPADESRLSAAGQGKRVFLEHCAKCHTVRGTGADSRLGPDLTHLMTRRTIGAGALANNTGSLSGWVANAQAIKPGACMPAMRLTPEELRDVVGYLQNLR